MEYITFNKGGRKLPFENNISIKQKVLSNGTVWGGYNGGILSMGILSGGFCPGDFVLGGFVQGILSRGFCPGGFVRGYFVLEPACQPSIFQCSTMSGSNFMERGGLPPLLQQDKKPSAHRVKIVPKHFLCLAWD